MMKTLLAAATTLVALPALADEVRISAPVAAGSLHTDDLALVAYYVPLDDGRVEVTATWLGANSLGDDAEARRLVMPLADGEKVAYSLPGHMDTLFTFARDRDAVTVHSAPAAAAIRNASL
jgi:hypothetical protein